MANNDIMNVMSMLGDVLNKQIEDVKQQAEEGKRKIENEVQGLIDKGKAKLDQMDAQFNERFNVQDKKLDQKIAEFRSQAVQPVEVKATKLEERFANMEVKHTSMDSEIKSMSTRANKTDEVLTAMGLVLQRKKN